MNASDSKVHTVWNLQRTNLPCENQRCSAARKSRLSFFQLFAYGFISVAAILASVAPVELAIASVFLFAGLHNWVELRYFLFKVPSQFGPLKVYFLSAVGGALLLSALYVAYLSASRNSLLSDELRMPLLAGWNTLMISWICALVALHGRQRRSRKWSILRTIAPFVVSAALLSPAWFTLLLVYAHPLIGMRILDLELRRKPAWRQTYRNALLLVPALLSFICWQTSENVIVPRIDPALWAQLAMQAGAGFIDGLAPESLVAMHVFLEVLHYGVWLIAIPVVTMGLGHWPVKAVPLERHSTKHHLGVITAVVLSSFAVLALWVMFSTDYTSTRELYFTVAIVHVLAEIPLLVRLI